MLDTGFSKNRGFIQFLLGNPLLLLSAGLGIALILTGLALKGYKARSDHWHTQYEFVNSQFGAFKLQVETEGKKAQAAAEAKEKHQQEVNRDLEKQVSIADSRLSDAIRRLRERPPVRPDGSEIGRASCVPEGAMGASQEPSQWVSLSDYRSIEERSARDVQTLRLIEEWVTKQSLRIE